MVEAVGELLGALGTASLHFLSIKALAFLLAGTCIGLLFGAVRGLAARRRWRC